MTESLIDCGGSLETFVGGRLGPIRVDNTVRYREYIAANIRALRHRAGMTQEQLAEAADLDPRFLQRIEHADTNLSVSALVLLADALGVHPSDLMRPATLAPSRPGRPARRESGLVVVKPRDDADPEQGVR